MGKVRNKGKDKKKKEEPIDRIHQADQKINYSNLFYMIILDTEIKDSRTMGKNVTAMVDNNGSILLNSDVWMSVSEWVYAIAHCQLHLAFGHYDMERVPGYWIEDDNGQKKKIPKYNKKIWNIACDIYITKFLSDARIGTPFVCTDISRFPAGVLVDEVRLYDYLLETGWPEDDQRYGVASPNRMDMMDADKPVKYGRGRNEKNWSIEFAEALAHAASKSVSNAGGNDPDLYLRNRSFEAAEWFVTHYPLLGSVAESFNIIWDLDFCRKNDIQIAAVNAEAGEIYLNPAKYFSKEEWRFILAHEYLHAGLDHAGRRQGRDAHLWNIACDYCINSWLFEMEVGKMPTEVLYDTSFQNMSAEAIYDVIMEDIRFYRKKETFRGNGMGDVLDGYKGKFRKIEGLTDDFFKNALRQGLEYEELNGRGRGFLPHGLVEEIRAIAVPPIPWDVALAEWFQIHISPLEKYRSYAHPSRRQSCTPDIPRPRYCHREDSGRTFGVVIDTSGSMKDKEIGIALGAVASYADANDVALVRVIFCDANAYDAGYMTTADIAGTVEITGRGGTILQPAVDLLENAEDFPGNGPILIITDGWIEKDLKVRREHAFLLPYGHRLPFRPRGEVFYFRDDAVKKA